MCQVLGVSANGYYAWCRRPESPRAQRDRHLKVLVRASFAASKQRHGSPRIYEDLFLLWRSKEDERSIYGNRGASALDQRPNAPRLMRWQRTAFIAPQAVRSVSHRSTRMAPTRAPPAPDSGLR